MSGRGGAGNIYAAQLARAATTNNSSTNHSTNSSISTAFAPDTDLEGNRGNILHDFNASDSDLAPRQSTQSSTYAHTGRGGAGNWYQPKQLAETGSFSRSSDVEKDVPVPFNATIGLPVPASNSPPATTTSVWRGRGGAGNYEPAAWTGAKEPSAEAVEASKRAERDVEMGLARPEKVWLGGGKERTDDAREALGRDATDTDGGVGGMKGVGVVG